MEKFRFGKVLTNVPPFDHHRFCRITMLGPSDAEQFRFNGEQVFEAYENLLRDVDDQKRTNWTPIPQRTAAYLGEQSRQKRHADPDIHARHVVDVIITRYYDSIDACAFMSEGVAENPYSELWRWKHRTLSGKHSDIFLSAKVTLPYKHVGLLEPEEVSRLLVELAVEQGRQARLIEVIVRDGKHETYLDDPSPAAVSQRGANLLKALIGPYDE